MLGLDCLLQFHIHLETFFSILFAQRGHGLLVHLGRGIQAFRHVVVDAYLSSELSAL